MFYRFLGLSLIVHMLLAATMLLPFGQAEQQPETVEVTYIDPSDRGQQKAFVTDPSAKLQESIKKLEDQVKRLSRTTQRVQQEQIARRTGKTHNADDRDQTGAQGSAGAAGQANNRNQADRNERTTNRRPTRSVFPRPSLAEQSDMSTPSIDKPMGSSSGGTAARVQLSQSTIAEFIPEVREGGFTSLNTDQFLHYTFYARINEQIRNRWVQHLRTFANNAGPNILNRLSQQPQLTELEVLLDKEGNFQDIIFHKRADHSDLDVAAGAALERSAPFLNPPAEIIKEDGYIHLFYSFYIHWRPQYIAKP